MPPDPLTRRAGAVPAARLPVAAVLVSIVLVVVGAGCSLVPMTDHPRPALPLPDAIAARYALPAAVVEQSIERIGGEDGADWFRGELASGDLRAVFHLVCPAGLDRPVPLVVCLPILAGGEDLMWYVATDLAERGFAAAWTKRAGSALRAPQRGAELEALFRTTVQHNRMLIEWARRDARFDAGRLGLFGISLGGMVGGALLAVEPELAGGVLCMAGGDLPDLLAVSTESRAVRWRAWRRSADAIARRELERELDRTLVSDPALLGPYVATERVLLVATTLDGVVPLRNQDLLWESLGRPQRLRVPLGHYTAIVAVQSVLDATETFLRRRHSAER